MPFWLKCSLLGGQALSPLGGLGSPTSRPVGRGWCSSSGTLPGAHRPELCWKPFSFCPIFQTAGVLSSYLLAQVQTCTQEMNPSLGPFSCSEGTRDQRRIHSVCLAGGEAELSCQLLQASLQPSQSLGLPNLPKKIQDAQGSLNFR